MSVLTRNNIVTNGLVLYLDAKNPQSIPVDPTINLIPYSQDFLTPGTASYYIPSDVTLSTGSFIAPDGTNTATLVTENTLNAIHRVYLNNAQNFTTSSGSYYTVSFYVKPNGRTRGASFWEWPSGRVGITYDLSNQTWSPFLSISASLYTASITPAPNGYYRISYTARDTASYAGINTFLRLVDDTGSLTYTGNGLSGSYIWGYQVEKNIYPSPYIRTFANSNGRITWSDLSGTNNNLTLISSSITSSIPQYNFLNERVLNFDGTGSNAILPATTFNSAPVTVSLTFKRPGITGNYLFMWDHINGGGGGRSQRVNDVGIQIYGTNNLINSISSQALTDALSVTNRWTNLTYTVTGSLVNVYVNGNPIITNFSMSSPLNSVSGAPLYVGKVDSGTTSYFTTGSFQSVLIYNRALSQNEVLQNYQTIKTRLSLT